MAKQWLKQLKSLIEENGFEFSEKYEYDPLANLSWGAWGESPKAFVWIPIPMRHWSVFGDEEVAISLVKKTKQQMWQIAENNAANPELRALANRLLGR